MRFAHYVNAAQFNGTKVTGDLAEILNSDATQHWEFEGQVVLVRTAERSFWLRPTEWVVLESDGQLHRWSDEEFRKKFEEVERWPDIHMDS